LPAMITAITAEVDGAGEVRRRCVSNTGSYPGPRLADHIARSAKTGRSAGFSPFRSEWTGNDDADEAANVSRECADKEVR
jgi:hypothetical protein